MSILLSVAKVEFGGNTGEGAYFYAFSKQTIVVKKNNTTIQFDFTKSTSDDFTMVDLISSDSYNTFSQPTFSVNKRSLEVKTNSTKQQLINVSVLVKDSSTGLIINCDPQVLNDPDLDPDL